MIIKVCAGIIRMSFSDDTMLASAAMVVSVYGVLRRRNGPCGHLRLCGEAKGHRGQIAAPIQAFDKHSHLDFRECRYNIWPVPQRNLPPENAQDFLSAGILRPSLSRRRTAPPETTIAVAQPALALILYQPFIQIMK